MNRKEQIAKLEEKIKRPDVDPLVRQDMVEEVTRLMNQENKNIIEVTIKVDTSSPSGCTLIHTCVKCGKVEQGKPISYEHVDYATGMRFDSDVFLVRQALSPKGWETLRVEAAMENIEQARRIVQVCPDCIRKFVEGT